MTNIKTDNMNTKTLEQMKQLRLHGMLRAFDTSLSPESMDYTNDELVAYLVQSEWDDRHNRKIERLTKAARFRYGAVMEAIDYGPGRNIVATLTDNVGHLAKGKVVFLEVVPCDFYPGLIIRYVIEFHLGD